MLESFEDCEIYQVVKDSFSFGRTTFEEEDGDDVDNDECGQRIERSTSSTRATLLERQGFFVEDNECSYVSEINLALEHLPRLACFKVDRKVRDNK